MCRGGISQGARLQSHVLHGTSDSEKMLRTHFFPLANAEYFKTIKVFVCFFLFRGESPKFRWLREALKRRPRPGRVSEGPQLRVGKPTHVNYLAFIQQEMTNDNRLGKEKQQNKQNVSRPSCNFYTKKKYISLFILSLF